MCRMGMMGSIPRRSAWELIAVSYRTSSSVGVLRPQDCTKAGSDFGRTWIWPSSNACGLESVTRKMGRNRTAQNPCISLLSLDRWGLIAWVCPEPWMRDVLEGHDSPGRRLCWIEVISWNQGNHPSWLHVRPTPNRGVPPTRWEEQDPDSSHIYW